MSDLVCPCVEESASTRDTMVSDCICPRDEHDIVVHEETCLLYKHEHEVIHSHELETCQCELSLLEENMCKCLCSCPVDQCRYAKAGKEVFDEWRSKRDVGAMPAVLESTHPLMKRFQETLKHFLEKENAIAEEEIHKLQDELQLSKQSYQKDLEIIYRNDQDTNAQRLLIEEYESTLAKKTAERQEAEIRVKDTKQKYINAKTNLETNTNEEYEAVKEEQTLTALCYQLKKWQNETDSDLAISRRMTDKMNIEKQELANEKREIDMIVLGLSNEVWKLESRLELLQKQLEIKKAEIDKVNEKVTAYAAELEDLDLEKRRLVSLWNSVLVNIKQRDKVYDSVCDDYRVLQNNYHTLVNSLEVSKKITMEEMNLGKKLAMNREKIDYDIAKAANLLNIEDTKRITLESQITELVESIEMVEQDEQLMKLENMTMRNILKTTDMEVSRRTAEKLKLENDILTNIQECLLNDKSVESMANGIRKMREMTRKQELSLSLMENQHAKILLDIKVRYMKQKRNKIISEDILSKVREREQEIKQLEESFVHKTNAHTRKQRELEMVLKKYNRLKEMFDLKSPQERRIEELENQNKTLREKTEHMQKNWLRLQEHVVKLTSQYNNVITNINFISKQYQICEQKTIRFRTEYSNITQERTKVKRLLFTLQGKLNVLERLRKEAIEKNQKFSKAKQAVTYEYSSELKDAETKIIQLEEDIGMLEREKINLTQELDRLQREALTWQKKGMSAVELKRNLQNAKSAVGEVGLMKKEVHRMEVRKTQLLKIGEKLSQDLALCVTRRETAMEKNRAAAAVEKVNGSAAQMSQFNYHHKVRLARADLTRVTKYVLDATNHIKKLQYEKQQIENEVDDKTAKNEQLEEHIALLMRQCHDIDFQKLCKLEQVVRSQRLGNELTTAVKRQSIKVKKPISLVLSEYQDARTFNNTLKNIIATLSNEYPYLNEQLEIISGTLNIHSPTDSPRFVEHCICGRYKEDNNNLKDQLEIISSSVDVQIPTQLFSITKECGCTKIEEDKNIAEKPEE